MTVLRLIGRPWKASSLFVLVLPVLFVVGLVIGYYAKAASGDEQAAKTLYDRLGGVPKIAAMMDDLIDRLYVNPIINENPAVQAAHLRTHPAVPKFMFTEYFCQATGGPCTYIGRSMVEAHDGLSISEAEWKVMMAEFQKTLDKFKVPEAERRELAAIVDYTKEDTVASPK